MTLPAWTPETMEAARIVEAEASLHFFIRLMWPVLEPETPFTDGWWPRAWCEHLEAVTNGEITRLLGNCPPGACKSLMTNVFWPAWVWGPRKKPWTRFLTAAYSQTLTERDNGRMRMLVQSPEYQRRWGHVFKAGDSKINFENDKTGSKVASSVGGTITGMRGDVFICLPWDTLILTNKGQIPIGRIVDERLDVRIAGWNGTAVEWQDIKAYEANPGENLIEINSGSGVLQCTSNHPVWIDGRGYIRADQVRPGDTLKAIVGGGLSDVRCHISEGQPEASLLLREVQRAQPEYTFGTELSRMRSGLPEATCTRQEEQVRAVLLAPMCVSSCEYWREECQVQRWSASSHMSAMRRGVCEGSGARGAGKLLFQTVWACGQSAKKQNAARPILCSVPQDVPSACDETGLLLQRVRQSGTLSEDTGRDGGQLRPWETDIPISDWVGESSCRCHSGQRQGYLPTMWDYQSRSWAQPVCTSYRLCEGEPGPGQSDLAVSELSQQGAWHSGESIRVEGATVRHVKRVDEVPGTVYNLRVGPHHNYFANGILLHNCDDPNNINESESKTIREATNRWVSEVLPTRLNSMTRSAIVVIQQRTHEEDVTGFLLRPDRGGDKWTYVMVPMVYSPDWTCGETSIGWRDPRTIPGELFWPERFPPDVVDSLRQEMTEYAFAGQLQQHPEPRGGAIIKRDWWKLYGREDEDPSVVKLKFPAFSYVVASLDCALTDKSENDPSALVILGVWEVPQTGRQAVMVIQCWAERHQLNPLVRRVAETCDKYRVDRLIIENKANGHSVQQELRRLFADAEWGIEMIDPREIGSNAYNKIARVNSVTHLFEEGMIWHPNTEWARALIDECSIFPKGSHDDRVDALIQGIRHLRDRGILYRRSEQRQQEQSLASLARGQVINRPLYDS